MKMEDLFQLTWLEADLKNKSGKVLAVPTREEIDLPVQEHLIVELYSKQK